MDITKERLKHATPHTYVPQQTATALARSPVDRRRVAVHTGYVAAHSLVAKLGAVAAV